MANEEDENDFDLDEDQDDLSILNDYEEVDDSEERQPGAIGPDGTYGMTPIPGDAIFQNKGAIIIYHDRLETGTRYFFYANNGMYYAERFYDHTQIGQMKEEAIARFENAINRKIPRSDINYEYRIEVR
jgi:hypothetical protein